MNLQEFYAPLIEKAADPQTRYQANGWGSRRSMSRRFKTAIDALGVRSGDSVLDWGCGTGELSHWLNEHAYDVKYTGIDILPEMVDVALANGVNAHAMDLPKSPMPILSYDWIVALGLLGAVEGSYGEKWDALDTVIKECRKLSRNGFAFTLLTDRNGVPHDDGVHWYTRWPSIVSEVLGRLDGRVTVHADYLPHEVMFVVRTDPF